MSPSFTASSHVDARRPNKLSRTTVAQIRKWDMQQASVYASQNDGGSIHPNLGLDFGQVIHRLCRIRVPNFAASTARRHTSPIRPDSFSEFATGRQRAEELKLLRSGVRIRRRKQTRGEIALIMMGSQSQEPPAQFAQIRVQNFQATRSDEIELEILEKAATPLRTSKTWAFRIHAVECLRHWVASPARLFFQEKGAARRYLQITDSSRLLRRLQAIRLTGPLHARFKTDDFSWLVFDRRLFTVLRPLSLLYSQWLDSPLA
ncbi:hypothetical protein CPB85DRAFT_1558810 [Mucidula mucida]|nr:hypothetical protein CPB85DRAFT_1558810 [Mucidula mucida]